MGKLTLTESEKTRIKQLHGLNSVDLINEQDMDNALSQRKCRAKYAKTSEKWTKKGYTKAEEGENYEEGYKTKELINGLCEKETWVKAKKEGNMITRMTDKMSDNKIAKGEASQINNLNSDIINNIVGAAIGTSGGVNMIDSKYITGTPRKSLQQLDRITRGLNIRNKEIKQLKEIVKTFRTDATLFWNETEAGLGGNDKIITDQFNDKGIRDIKDMFRRNMSNLASYAVKVGKNVGEKLSDNPCSTAMSKTSVKDRKKY